MLAFSNQAVEAFLAGDADTKRTVLRLAGSNPRLTDRNLSIEAAKPLQMVRDLPAVLERCGLRNDVRTGGAQDGLKAWRASWSDSDVRDAISDIDEALDVLTRRKPAGQRLVERH